MLPKRHKLLQHTTRFGCRDHGIGLYLHTEGIDTSSASFALLDIIAAYRPARLSEAIRGEQAKSVAAGKRIGRPIVPPGVEDRTHKALADGRGIRLTARQFNVSPAKSSTFAKI
jgi:DNA invertase Pin-like site-specific DNA recombinase